MNEIQEEAATQEEKFTEKEVSHIITEFSEFIKKGNK